jgi:hypothetical protein
MKFTKKKLLVVTVMLAATLGISAYARKIGTQAGPDEHITLRVNSKTPATFDYQLRAGKVVEMTATYPDGDNVALKQQSKPTCATTCPAGQHLSCWEDQQQQMSICVCSSASGGKQSSSVVSLGKLGRVE